MVGGPPTVIAEWPLGRQGEGVRVTALVKKYAIFNKYIFLNYFLNSVIIQIMEI